jgi:O-antigen ligase
MSLKRVEQNLFLLCLIFLPTQLGKHFWPTFSLVYSLPVDYLSPTVYFWDLLLVSLVVVWLIRLFKNPKREINWLALNLWLLFILTLLPSLLVAKNLGASLSMLERLLTASLFGLYISFQKLKDIKRFLFWGLTVAVLYEAVIAFLEFLTGSSLNIWIFGFSVSTPSIATFNYLGQVFLRPYATFSHPNVLAAFMVIALPIIGLMPENIGRQRFFKFLAFILGGITIFLTFSRSAIAVGFAEGFIVLRKRLKWAIIPLILVIPFLWIRYNSVFNFDNLSLLRREELDVIALVDIRQSPIFGIGLNNFINQTASSSLISGPTRFLQPVHNIFLLSLSETGVVGFLGFLAFILLPIRHLWQSGFDKSTKTQLFLWLSIVSLGMVDHYFLTLPQGQRLLFIVWGLSMIQ